ncbi:Glycinamide ribonucleotide synthetase [Trichoderma simmonsii]|uniref:phosphoribosylamine--glycine ligase n=1 Tax=Trichoderma simmonsii TaxID=1491479 RepID=A0A8G0L4A4_9HYPO|nr:Glycinamide ribonucleotide synthetase [Trichoderma simmonsii]
MNDDIHKRRILLIGSGGREHALAWKLSQSVSVEHVFVFPGNAGTVQMEKISNVVDESIVSERDYPALVKLALKLNIGLVVVGPDSAVVDGIEGYFRESGIPCFAPSKEAAELEGSKTFAKDFMRKYEIPTAGGLNFDLSVAADLELAKVYVHTVFHNVVIKASGLAAGKGVVFPSSAKEACEELDSFANGRFGDSGRSVVVEEYLEGDEISVLTFSDGESFKSLPLGQDHKRIFNGNTGPNTGGMGVYAPTTFVTDEMMFKIEATILKPTFDGLRAEGIMITPSGPKVLEYNVRFGDPETQTMMLLLSQNTDLAAVLLACTQGTLKDAYLGVRLGYACNVVISSAGYPGPYSTGKPIRLDPILSPDIHIFHAGTKLMGDVLQTAGGRVFSVAAYGDSLGGAVRRAYQGVKAIHFEGMHFRTDITGRYTEKRGAR